MTLSDLFRTGGWSLAPSVSSENATQISRIGTVAGRYEITSLIAEGGMSTIYKGVRIEAEFKHVVAVKVLHLHQMTEADASAQVVFQRETQSLSRLSHPHIATIIDAGKLSDGAPYIIMEFVDGVPLDTFLVRSQPDRATRLSILTQVLDAVSYAHSHFIAHGDLKPSNILIRGDQHVVLVDFGISHLLRESGADRSESSFLTPAYASPEQLSGQPPSVSSDIYQLGIIIQLLQGKKHKRGLFPIAIDDLEEKPSRFFFLSAFIRSLFASDRTVAEDQWLALLALGRRAASCEPAQRYSTVSALIDEVSRLQGKLALSSVSLPGMRVFWFVRRYRPWVLFFSLVITIVSLHLIQLDSKNRQLRQALLRSERLNGFLVDIFEANDPFQQNEQPLREVSARELLDRSRLKIDSLENEPEQQAELLHVLGSVYRNLGRYKDAQELLEKSLEKKSELYGRRNMAAAEVMHDLSLVLFAKRDNREAKALIEEEISIRRMYQSEKNEALISANMTLARVNLAVGDFNSAVVLAKKNLSVQQSVNAPDSREIAEALYELGDIQVRTSDFAAGIEALLASLDLYKRIHPVSSLSIAKVNSALSYAHFSEGKFSLAEKNALQAIEIYREAFGEKHPEVTLIEGRLGQILSRSGRFNEAESVFSRVSRQFEDYYGSTSNRASGVLPEMAISQAALGKCKDANETMLVAVQKANSDQRLRTYILYFDLFIKILQKRGAFKSETEKLIAELPNGYEDNPVISVIYATIAEALIAEGKLNEANVMLRKASDYLEKNQASLAWYGHYTNSIYGLYYRSVENLALAEKLLVSGYEGVRSELGEFHYYSMAAGNRLSDYLESVDRQGAVGVKFTRAKFPNCQ